MDDFSSLVTALERWFEKPLSDLPDELRQRTQRNLLPMTWDKLNPDQRRSAAYQWDCRHNPALEQERKSNWKFFARRNAIKQKINEWQAVTILTATDLAQQETRLAELDTELVSMGDPPFIAHPKAFELLANQHKATPNEIAAHKATPNEIAAWVWMGPKEGGLTAYLSVNELDPPPEFSYALCDTNDHDYLSPLMSCWFLENDISNFKPIDRFITGEALIERWKKQPGIQPRAFISAKIAESRLADLHPITGGTQGSFPDDELYPPLESALFMLSHVEIIEAEDFADKQSCNSSAENQSQQVKPEVGSPEWRRQTAQDAVNARHDKPGGSRDKQKQMRKIWATGKYSSRDICAEQEYAAIGMSYSTARKALINAPTPKKPT
jgi:hypothetical protein